MNQETDWFLGRVSKIHEDITSGDQNHIVNKSAWIAALGQAPADGSAYLGEIDVEDWKRYMRLVISLLGATPFYHRDISRNKLTAYTLYYIYINTVSIQHPNFLDLFEIIKLTWNQKLFIKPGQRDRGRGGYIIEDIWHKQGLTPFLNHMSDIDKTCILYYRKKIFRGISRDDFFPMLNTQGINMQEWISYLIGQETDLEHWNDLTQSKKDFIRNFYDMTSSNLKTFVKTARFNKVVEAENPLIRSISLEGIEISF